MKIDLSLNKFVDLRITGSYVPAITYINEEQFPAEFLITNIEQIKGNIIQLIDLVQEYPDFDKMLDEKILNEIEN